MYERDLFIKVDEVAEKLDVSKPYAYKLVKRLNTELQAKGYMTIAGRVSRRYYEERFYGLQPDKKRGV